MKRLLILSLALNLLLGGLAWWRTRHAAPIPRLPRGAVGEPAAQGDSTRGGARVTRLAPVQAAADTPWARLESRDPAKLIANLRALGCPEQTIRDIVVFRVARRYREQLLAAEEAAVREWSFSHSQSQKDFWEQQDVRSELRNQMLAEIERLFGPGAASLETLVGPAFKQAPDFLSSATRQQVRELDTRHQRLTRELESQRMTGTLAAEGAARLAELERQKQAELAQILSPSEQEEYLYRESPAARYVLQNLPQAKSEAEFRAIVKVAAETGMDPNANFNARYGIEPADPALVKAEADKQAEFQRRLSETLGADRVAEQEAQKQAEAEQARLQEQQRTEQQERARLATLAESVGVSAEAANQFWDRIKERQPEFETKFKALESSLTGTPEEKQKQMEAAIKAELEKQAVEIMGDKGPEFLQKAMEHGH